MTATGALIAQARALAARNGRPLRFVLAGAANTVFGLAAYPVLLWSSDWLHRHYMIGLGVAQAASLCFAFVTYRIALSSLRARGSVAREVGLFSSFYIVTFVLNWLALPVLVGALRLDPVLAQFGFAGALIVAGYLWHSRLTFPARTPS